MAYIWHIRTSKVKKVWLITPTIARICPLIGSRKAKYISKILFQIPGLEKEIIQVIKFLTTLSSTASCVQARELTPAASVNWPWKSFYSSISFSSASLISRWGNLTQLSDSAPRPSEPPDFSLSSLPCALYLDLCHYAYICSLGYHLPFS